MIGFVKRVFIEPRTVLRELPQIIASRSGFRALARLGCTSLFSARPADAFSPNWEDLWFLFRTVMSRRPKCVLEYGSGCSTIIIAEALSRVGEGKLVSIEAEERWADVTARTLPAHLRSVVDLRVEQPEEQILRARYGGQRRRRAGCYVEKKGVQYRGCGVVCLRYPKLDALRPNYVFIDGPDVPLGQGLTDALGRRLPSIVADPLFIERDAPADFYIALDARYPNSWFLRDNLQRRYRARFRRAPRINSFQLVN